MINFQTIQRNLIAVEGHDSKYLHSCPFVPEWKCWANDRSRDIDVIDKIVQVIIIVYYIISSNVTCE